MESVRYREGELTELTELTGINVFRGVPILRVLGRFGHKMRPRVGPFPAGAGKAPTLCRILGPNLLEGPQIGTPQKVKVRASDDA